MTAILGWGSLLWDRSRNREFDSYHHPWLQEGPVLKLEFSRISRSRAGALTLVIDPLSGSPCQVRYALSKRLSPKDAVCDLRTREDTTMENIGWMFAERGEFHSKHPELKDEISAWARARRYDAVIWTDLESNYERTLGRPFSAADAVAYLRALPPMGTAKAIEYVSKAASSVRTPLRTLVEQESWFAQAAGGD